MRLHFFVFSLVLVWVVFAGLANAYGASRSIASLEAAYASVKDSSKAATGKGIDSRSTLSGGIAFSPHVQSSGLSGPWSRGVVPSSVQLPGDGQAWTNLVYPTGSLNIRMVDSGTGKQLDRGNSSVLRMVKQGRASEHLIVGKSGGIEDFVVFDGPSSSGRVQISWELDLPKGWALEQGSGRALVYDHAGNHALTITAPISEDRGGKRLPTSLTVEGSMVRVDVDDSDASGGWVLDPHWEWISTVGTIYRRFCADYSGETPSLTGYCELSGDGLPSEWSAVQGPSGTNYFERSGAISSPGNWGMYVAGLDDNGSIPDGAWGSVRYTPPSDLNLDTFRYTGEFVRPSAGLNCRVVGERTTSGTETSSSVTNAEKFTRVIDRGVGAYFAWAELRMANESGSAYAVSADRDSRCHQPPDADDPFSTITMHLVDGDDPDAPSVPSGIDPMEWYGPGDQVLLGYTATDVGSGIGSISAVHVKHGGGTVTDAAVDVCDEDLNGDDSVPCDLSDSGSVTVEFNSTNSAHGTGNTLAWQAGDFSGRTETGSTTTYKYDSTVPSVGVIDGSGVSDVDWTSAANELPASWTATDADSGIATIRYCVGTDTLSGSCHGSILVPWTNGISLSATNPGMPTARDTTYFTCVEATDNSGNVQRACSDGQEVALPVIPRDGDDIFDVDHQVSTTDVELNWDAVDDQVGASYDWWVCSEAPCVTSLDSGTTSSLSASADSMTLVPGARYFVCVEATDHLSYTGGPNCSDGISVDTTAPVMDAPRDGLGDDVDTLFANSVGIKSVTGNWDTADDGTGIGASEYRIKVCADSGCSTAHTLCTDDTCSSTASYLVHTDLESSSRSIRLNSAVTSGTIYWCMAAEDALGNLSGYTCSDGAALAGGSGTTIAGSTITSSTTWSLANSPISVTGHITVSGSSTVLNIDPGVQVRFTGSNANLATASGGKIVVGENADIQAKNVNIAGTSSELEVAGGAVIRIIGTAGKVTASGGGHVELAGSASNPILLTSDDDAGGVIGTGSSSTGWSGLNFTSGSNELSHVNVRYTYTSACGVEVSGTSTSAVIEDSSFTFNLGCGIAAVNGSTGTVDNSVVHSSETGVSMTSLNATSLVVRDSVVKLNTTEGINASVKSTGVFRVENSQILENGRDGIRVGRNGTFTGPAPMILGNQIRDNGATSTSSSTGYGVSLSGTSWGTESVWPVGHGNVFSANGDGSGGGAAYGSKIPDGSDTAGASKPHWDGNDWGVSPTASYQFITGSGGGACDTTQMYGNAVAVFPLSTPVRSYPAGIDVYGYDNGSGLNKTICIQTTLRAPVPGALSGQSLGIPGQLDDSANNSALAMDPVNTLSGSFVDQALDIENPALGIPLRSERTYNSADASSGALGLGWSWSLGMKLEFAAGGLVTAHLENGQRAYYFTNGDGTFSGRAGTRSELTSAGSPITSYTLTRKDQSTLVFDDDGRLTDHLDRNGHGVTLTYTGAATVPDSAEDESGNEYTFSYDGSDKLTQILSTDGRSVEFAVDNDQLVSVTDVRGEEWTYTYDGNDLLESKTSPEGIRQYLNTYSSGRVVEQKDPLGRVTEMAWNGGTQTATQTDAAGAEWTYVYSGSDLIEKTDPLGRTTTFTYDQRGNLASKTDPRGNRWQYVSDSDGNLVRSIAPAPLNYVERMSYDANNNLTQKIDGRGYITNYTYDGQSNLTFVKRQDGAAPGGIDQNVTEYVRDATTKQVEEIVDPAGNSTFYTYHSGTHYLASVTGTLGEPRTFDYDAAGRVSEVVDPVGNASGNTPADYATTYLYDQAGNVLETTDAYTNVTERAYNQDGRLDHLIDPHAERWDFEYDGAGQLSAVIDPAIGVASRKDKTFRYDARGLLTREVDQLGRVTTHTYDKSGQRMSTVAPKGNVSSVDPDLYRTRYVYDASGNLKAEIDPMGHQRLNRYDALNRLVLSSDERHNDTRYFYDATSNLVGIHNPSADSETRAYDSLGRMTSLTDYRANTHRYEHNEVGQVTEHRTPEQHASGPVGTIYCYDDNGRLSAKIDARAGAISCGTGNSYQTDYSYDEAGRLVLTEGPEGNDEAVSYDRAGRLESKIDGEANVTEYTYTDSGQLHEVIAPDHPLLGDRVTEYTYNEVGDRVSRINPNGATTSYDFDDAHQLTQITRPGGYSENFQYDLNGNRIVHEDANGTASGTPGDGVKTYDFDRANRMVGIDYSGSTPDVSITRDAAGNVVEAVNSASSDEFTYDEQNRLTSFDQNGDVFSYSYDEVGNVTSRTYPGQSAVPFAFDADNRLSEVGTSGAIAEYGYDDTGNPTNVTLGNGVEQIRSYDNASRLVGIESEKSAVTIEDMSWTLDGVGNPVTLSADGRDETYEYDEMNQLTDACYQALCVSNDPSVSYTYDLVGNRLSEVRRDGMATVTRDYTYAVDGSDRLEEVDDGTTTENYAYDDNGNATLIADEDATYDQENQMTSLTNGMDTYDYAYGPQGNRVSADDGTTLQEFLWDVNQPNAQLAIERHNSSLHRKYNYGLGRITTNDGSATSYFLADRVGSTTHVTDASGNVDQTYTYEPFGTERDFTKIDSGAPDQDMLYAGEQLDPTGLAHLRARQYESSTGRFAGQDSLEWPTQLSYMNSYQYGFNNPTRFTDPSGAWPGEDAANWVGNKATDAAYSYSGAVWKHDRVFKSFEAADVLLGGSSLLSSADQCWNGEWEAGNANALLKPRSDAALTGSHCADLAVNAAMALPAGKAAKALDGARDIASGAKKGSKINAGPSCLRNSFPGDTPVQMADGSSKSIKLIRKGDRILASDPVTGIKAPQTVTATWSHKTRDKLLLLRTNTGVITTTPEHWLWNTKEQAWIAAAELAVGDVISTASGRSTISNITSLPGGGMPVYDLTVTGTHTFYANEILVHNCGGPPLKPLHPESSLSPSTVASLRNASTDEIIGSFKNDPLLVKADGTIMNGNTRYYELLRRGYDVDSLPRTAYP